MLQGSRYHSSKHRVLPFRFLASEFNEWKESKDAASNTHLTKRKKQAMPQHPLLTATLVNKHWVQPVFVFGAYLCI